MNNKIYILVFLWLVGFTAQAQLVDNPIGDGGGTTRYYFDSDGDGFGDPNSNWLSSPANRYVPNNADCNDNDDTIYPEAPELCDGKDNNCDGNVDESVKPGIPSAPTSISMTCGVTKITRSNPPNGITWYWQTSPTGTSTNVSSATYDARNGNTIYLRGQNNFTKCWGSARTINYSIQGFPETPPMPTITKLCGKTVFTRGNPPPGVTWYWRELAATNEPSSTAKTFEMTSGTRIYLTAQNDATGCWSAARFIDYSVNEIPVVPSSVSITKNCGNTVLTRLDAPTGFSWFWQLAADETKTATINAAKTYSVSSGNKMYLKARNNATGCWSSARTINYTVDQVPATPTITGITNNCGNTVVTRGTVPNGETWYWKRNDDEVESIYTSSSITFEKGSIYYLKAKNNSSGCWSAARVINYSVNAIPEVPNLPTITKNCGNTVLTKTASPNGITWFWQTTSNGTETEILNSSITYTATSGTRIFLRSRVDNTGCWGGAREITFTINQKSTWYADGDNDGYGDPNQSISACEQPSGYVADNTDQCPDDGTLQQGCSVDTGGLNLSNENYVFSRAFQKAMTSESQISETADVIENITYFDGLGRTKQQVAIKSSPSQKDIVSHTSYDVIGRQSKQYLPFERTTSNGSFKTVNVISDINSYYKSKYPNDFTGVATTSSDFNAFSETVFENSPLNRTLEQGAPGKSWKANRNSDTDHTIKFNWRGNNTDEVVRFDVNFEFNNTERPVLVKHQNNYRIGQLNVTITKDENRETTDGNNHTTIEYKDKLGRVVLKRTYESGIPHETHYVYDRFGNLTFVISPKVTVEDGVSPEELSELCYQYKYDYRNRLIEKKIPGKGWEYIVYNKLDQPVLTQDANLRKVNTGKRFDYWLFTKYDAHGRVAYTGKIINNSTRKILQSRAQSASYTAFEKKSSSPITVYGVNVYYTKTAYPTSMQNIYTQNYYDTYDFDIAGLENPVTVYGEAISNRTTSLPTGSKVRVLGTNHWITTVTYYDKKGRPIYVASKNSFLETTDIVESKLDFTGKVLETKSTHIKGTNTPIVTIDKFTYDHVGRLLTQVQTINDLATEQIVANTYDALGQLVTKKVGGTIVNESQPVTSLQKVDYTYNVRGWLKQINNPDALGDDLFGFKIAHNDVRNGATPLYNGNISETEWKTANDNQLRWYKYNYDALNRLKSTQDNENKYSTFGIEYDKNGNIYKLKRHGFKNASDFNFMDDLTYAYDNGNKLLKVTDAGNIDFGFKDGVNTNDDFEYDINGNMIVDRNKGITAIVYNHLNLPTQVTINGKNIDYTYDATGNKLRKLVNNVATDYAGDYVYENNDLQFFNHPEGYIEPITENGSTVFSSLDYIYQYKDHLGNIRLSYKNIADNGTVENQIVQEKNYYAFGLAHKGYNETVNGRNHKYGYNGKEENNEESIEWLDFGARNFDATIGRWMNIDPLSEKYNNLSVFAFVSNKPIVAFDPDGRKIVYAGETRKDRRELKKGFKKRLKSQLKNSKDFRKAWRTLRKSKKEYRFRVESSIGFGQFSPTESTDFLKWKLDEYGNITNPEESATDPKRAGGDIFISHDAWNNEHLGAHTIVEEIMHALQFDKTISLEEARNFDYTKWPELSGNREFEAKMMTGIINSDAGIPFFQGFGSLDGKVSRSAQKFGVNFRKNGGNATTYFNNLKKWQKLARDEGSDYGKFTFDKTQPSIIKFK